MIHFKKPNPFQHCPSINKKQSQESSSTNNGHFTLNLLLESLFIIQSSIGQLKAKLHVLSRQGVLWRHHHKTVKMSHGDTKLCSIHRWRHVRIIWIMYCVTEVWWNCVWKFIINSLKNPFPSCSCSQSYITSLLPILFSSCRKIPLSYITQINLCIKQIYLDMNNCKDSSLSPSINIIIYSTLCCFKPAWFLSSVEKKIFSTCVQTTLFPYNNSEQKKNKWANDDRIFFLSF